MGRKPIKVASDQLLGVALPFLRKLGGLKHGFPQSGEYVLTWRGGRDREKIAEMLCRLEPAGVAFSFALVRGDTRQHVSLAVPFTWTATRFGGKRAWFLCQCGRRAGKIFFQGERYGCIACFNLTHESTRECRMNRAWGRIAATGKQLKLTGPLSGRFDYQQPKRPRYIHRRRFYRLCRQLEYQYWQRDAEIGRIYKRLFPERVEGP